MSLTKLYALKYEGELYTKFKRQNAFTRLQDAKAARTRLAKKLAYAEAQDIEDIRPTMCLQPVEIRDEKVNELIDNCRRKIDIVEYFPMEARPMPDSRSEEILDAHKKTTPRASSNEISGGLMLKSSYGDWLFKIYDSDGYNFYAIADREMRKYLASILLETLTEDDYDEEETTDG